MRLGTAWLEGVFPKGSLRQRFAAGTFWVLAGMTVAQGLQLLASIIVARWLGGIGYGELGIINSTIGMLGSLTGLGLGLTATKHIAEFRGKSPDRAGRIVGLCMLAAAAFGLVASVVVIAYARPLAASILNAPHLVGELQLSCGLLFLNTLCAVQSGALAGLEKFAGVAKINIARGLFNFPFMIAGTYVFGLRGAIGGQIVGAACGWMFGQVLLDRQCEHSGVRVAYHGAWEERTTLAGFSLPAFLAAFISSPIMWIGNALLVNRPNGYAQMGVFHAANQWRIGMTFIPVVTNQVLLPILSNLYGDRDAIRFKKVLGANLAAVGGLSFLMFVPMAILSRTIMAAYGPGFARGSLTLILLGLSAVLSGPASVIGSAIAGQGRMWAGFGLNLIWAAAFLIACGLLIDLGAEGLAAVYLVSYFIHLVFVGVYAQKSVKEIGWPSGIVVTESAPL